MAATLLLSACSQEAPQQAATPTEPAADTLPVPFPAAQIKPAISFNILMVKFVDQAADPIWNAAVTPPKTDAEWEADRVPRHAAGRDRYADARRAARAPMDMEWTNCAGLGVLHRQDDGGALAAAQAARNKDVAALQTAGDDIVLNCEGCHREFKLELPTEGLATHLTRGIIVEEPKAEGAQ